MILPQNNFINVIIVTLIISLPGNFFIMGVNLLDFLKNRRLPLSDQLMFSFSIFNILHELLDIVVFSSRFFNEKTMYVYMYFDMCSVTFSALLSIHFCLKIVNINHWVYIGLQRRFSEVLPWPLMTFVLGYFFLSLYSSLEIKPGCLLNTTSNVYSLNLSPRCSWSLLILVIDSGLCALLCMVSALTILIFLFKHMKRIQENTEGSRSPNMDAHIRAVKIVIALLVANILIFSSLIFNVVVYNGSKKLDTALVEILHHCPSLTWRTPQCSG
ncbi:hypothetical protein GDO81_020462 [Engystomops pustulosus]|uniref:Taste receptor type 2 n=1 Tax=Engystomops pustulosus TaxID=76066 RepID=A0AAV6ZHN6_ENGPU|nr:hypothetical protein GDO81_020462 [Engystomops pustulosus]